MKTLPPLHLSLLHPAPLWIILVENPKVGKSVIFNYLTGTYRMISNYPETKGSMTILQSAFWTYLFFYQNYSFVELVGSELNKKGALVSLAWR